MSVVRRAAFDLGGGSFRVLVADVDTSKEQPTKKIYNQTIALPLRKSLQRSPSISPDMEEEATRVLLRLKEQAAAFSPISYCATATEAFRLATNGKEVIDRLSSQLGIRIELIEQQKEAELGFLAAVANSPVIPEKAVVIDLGSGSIQITSLHQDKSYDIFGAKLGTQAIGEILHRRIRGQSGFFQTINPVSKEEAVALIGSLRAEFAAVSDTMKQKLASSDVAVILSCDPLFEETSWQRNDLWEAITSQVLNRHEDVSTAKALLLYTIMDELQIEKLSVIATDSTEGSTSGLIASDVYWQ